MSLEENYLLVQKRIENACLRAGRDLSKITLIAVSKTKPEEDITTLYNLGHRVFGENRVQEMSAKADDLPKDILWHLIGHLQQNKVKTAVAKSCMIHSVDSLKLAAAISKEATKAGKTVPILIEINVAEEESKFGLGCRDIYPFISEVKDYPGIKIMGFMTVAPFVENPEENRPIFRKLKQISVDINREKINNIYLSELSMGMTNDYEIAIEEGATMVRVGTAIFGNRDYGNLGV